MRQKIYLSGMIVGAGMLFILASGCASSQQLEQPPMTSHMKSAVGTSDELSPLAPPEARHIRKVGNEWRCDINGQEMRYNSSTAVWEKMLK